MRPLPHRQSFATHPLAFLAAALASGIALAQFIHAALPLLVAPGVVFASLALVFLVTHKAFAASILLATSFLFAGAVLATLEQHSARSDSLRRLLDEGTISAGNPIELTGVLVSQPEPASESFHLLLQAEAVRCKGVQRSASGVVSMLLPVPVKTREAYSRLNLRYGARIRVMVTVKRADNFRNPGVSSFTEYLEQKGYDATGFVKSPALVERLDDRAVFPPLAWLYAWRERLQEKINSQFNQETAAVLNASLLGNRYFLSRQTSERFRAAGTFHVLVISGLHISFIGGIVFVIARRITKRKEWQFLVSSFVVWSYAIAVGAEASVVRAALMFSLISFAPIVARRAASVNALGATGLILLVRRPSDLFDPSFQLTFASVAAIVIVAWPVLQRVKYVGAWQPTREQPYPPTCPLWLRNMAEVLFWSESSWQSDVAGLNYRYKLFKVPIAEKLERYRLQRFCRYAFAALVVSLSVQATLLPFQIIYFHRVSVSAIVLNIGVSFLIALLTFVAIAAMLIGGLCQMLAAPLIHLANALDWLLVHSVDPFSSFAVASVRLPEYTGRAAAIYVLFYLPLVIVAAALSRWNPLARDRTGRKSLGRWVVRAAVVVQVLFAFVILWHPFSAAAAGGKLRIDFLDVGQGDAALVTLPDGTTLLIDGGGRPSFRNRDQAKVQAGDDAELFEPDTRSIGEAVVSEYLWWRGLDRVDYILATHADADHISGLNDVARNFGVRAALVARAPLKDPEYLEFSHTLDEQRIAVHVIAAGDTLQIGAATAKVLWPSFAADAQAPSRNNDSIVLLLRYGTRRILLTGDVESGGEAGVVARGNELLSDVVKVAHHGSRTSSIQSFVNATRPKFAIVSVGQTSMFGHPHREVIERWLSAGSTVLTTGKNGTITVTTDGRDLQMETFVKE